MKEKRSIKFLGDDYGSVSAMCRRFGYSYASLYFKANQEGYCCGEVCLGCDSDCNTTFNEFKRAVYDSLSIYFDFYLKPKMFRDGYVWGSFRLPL